jgi:benzoyl-CoA reductase/2-hydroxyglutaryl-CoA dehydratase subunit BcrC/BadD/HgdB
MPDPRAIDLLERCGCAIAGDSLCTGSHQLARIPMDPASEPFQSLAAATLRRPPCGRTVTPGTPCRLASLAVEDAWRCGARGIVAHVVKFCDPMLARLPAVRGACEAAGMPLLVLEGDCTLRSLGQNRTRVEAFVEMLQGGRP